MSGRREHKRRYNQKLEFISRFEEWLAQEPPMFPCFWHWRKWRDNRPRFTGTEYKDKALCEKCERLHKQGLTIVRARFLPVTQDNTGMPVTIEVEVKDGKETRRATYKR